MREQVEHRGNVIADFEKRKKKLQQELDSLAKEKDALVKSSFPSQMLSIASSMPQVCQNAKQYREALEKMLKETELSASQQQELSIALNGLWSAANNPKVQKKFKKSLAKMEPQLAILRTHLQKSILQKREMIDVRGDLVKDLQGIEIAIKEK